MLDSVAYEVQCAHRILLQDLAYILESIRGLDVDELRKHVRRLKQSDGEGWAIGELLDRAIYIMLEYDKRDNDLGGKV